MRICFRFSTDGWYCVTKGKIVGLSLVSVEGLVSCLWYLTFSSACLWAWPHQLISLLKARGELQRQGTSPSTETKDKPTILPLFLCKAVIVTKARPHRLRPMRAIHFTLHLYYYRPMLLARLQVQCPENNSHSARWGKKIAFKKRWHELKEHIKIR